MATLRKILQSIERLPKGEVLELWHGTGVHPDDMAKNIGSTEPKFSSEFFRKGKGLNRYNRFLN